MILKVPGGALQLSADSGTAAIDRPGGQDRCSLCRLTSKRPLRTTPLAPVSNDALDCCRYQVRASTEGSAPSSAAITVAAC